MRNILWTVLLVLCINTKESNPICYHKESSLNPVNSINAFINELYKLFGKEENVADNIKMIDEGEDGFVLLAEYLDPLIKQDKVYVGLKTTLNNDKTDFIVDKFIKTKVFEEITVFLDINLKKKEGKPCKDFQKSFLNDYINRNKKQDWFELEIEKREREKVIKHINKEDNKEVKLSDKTKNEIQIKAEKLKIIRDIGQIIQQKMRVLGVTGLNEIEVQSLDKYLMINIINALSKKQIELIESYLKELSRKAKVELIKLRSLSVNKLLKVLIQMKENLKTE